MALPTTTRSTALSGEENGGDGIGESDVMAAACGRAGLRSGRRNDLVLGRAIQVTPEPSADRLPTAPQDIGLPARPVRHAGVVAIVSSSFVGDEYATRGWEYGKAAPADRRGAAFYGFGQTWARRSERPRAAVATARAAHRPSTSWMVGRTRRGQSSGAAGQQARCSSGGGQAQVGGDVPACP